MKFSTIVSATGFEQLVRGKEIAMSSAILRGYQRLQRVSGLNSLRNVHSVVEWLPRTGDNIRMRITWKKYAGA